MCSGWKAIKRGFLWQGSWSAIDWQLWKALFESIKQIEFPNILFFIPLFHHFTLRFFSFQCSNCGSYMIWFANLGIFCFREPCNLDKCNVLCCYSNTGCSMSLFFFFLKHEEIHEPLPFLKKNPLTFKISHQNCTSSTMIDNASIST